MPRPGTTTPLVGRVAELAALSGALERAAAGRAGLVLLAGDAGVGKTRLVDELRGRAADAGALVLVGRCLEAGGSGLPYLPFAEALHGLPAAGEGAALGAHPALARMLPQLAPPPAEPPADDGLGRLPLFDAVHALLTGLAVDRPVLLVLEDLHWADRSTRDLLSFLAARLRAERLLLLGSYRADDLHRRHPLRAALAELVRLPATERVALAPFDPADADRFVRAVADGRLDDAAVRRVAARSEGNAFLAEELLAAGAAGGELPPDLADVLLARFEQLPAEVQHVVRVAAVGGRRVRHGRLQRVAAVAEDELEAALRVAVERSVLAPDPSGEGYSFRHALTQEAVYSDLLPGQRARLHAAYAGVLASGAGPGVAAELAHHSLASGAQVEALAASVAAAEEAVRGGAPAEALRHVEQALELWSAVPDPAGAAGLGERDLMLRASTAASAAGDPERALAHARAAASTVDDGAGAAEAAAVARVLGRHLAALELEDEAVAVGAAALQRWGDRPDDPGWVELLADQAAALYYAQRTDEAERTARRAVAAARELGMGAVEADALVTVGLVASRTGRSAEGIPLFEQASALAAETGAVTTRLRALHHLGITLFEHDRAAEGLVTVDEGVRLAEAAGLTWSTFGLELRVMQVLVRAVLGDWDGAERAARITNAVVSRLVEARVAAAGVWVATGRGRFDEAEELLTRVRPHVGADSQIAVLIGLNEIELHLWRDEPGAAVDAARRALDRLDADGDGLAFATVRLCALALDACARLDGSGPAADDLHARVRATMDAERPGGRRPGPEALAWELVADAEHGRVHGRDDPALWARAADLFAFGAVYERARCRWREAAAHLAAGDRDAAAAPLREAAAVAERLGARPLATAVARLAARAGLGPRPAGTPLLTPREQAVLDLVAGGRTNRQVGAELFISEKTVSVHLSRVMAKLGAGSRTEAVALASGRGLLGQVHS